MPIKHRDNIHFDDQGFVWLEGFKLPFKFFLRRMEFQFYDKDKIRSERRGYAFIQIHLVDLMNFILKQKHFMVCPVCFQEREIRVRVGYVDSELALFNQCTTCKFEWRHDEWT